MATWWQRTFQEEKKPEYVLPGKELVINPQKFKIENEIADKIEKVIDSDSRVYKLKYNEKDHPYYRSTESFFEINHNGNVIKIYRKHYSNLYNDPYTYSIDINGTTTFLVTNKLYDKLMKRVTDQQDRVYNQKLEAVLESL